jgi:hypothetical protein
MLPHAHPETLGIPTGDLQEIGVVHVEKQLGRREHAREVPRALVEGRPGLFGKAREHGSRAEGRIDPGVGKQFHGRIDRCLISLLDLCSKGRSAVKGVL